MSLFKKKPWKIYGNDSPEILIAGHSHAFSMHMAIQNNAKFQKYFGLVSQSDLKKSQVRDSEYWAFVSENSGKATVGLVWNGNQHNIHFLVDSNQQFKVFGLLDDENNFPAISYNRAAELFKPTMDELRSVINKFFVDKDFVIVGTPPPKSKEFLDKKIHLDKFFLNLANELEIPLDKLETTRDSTRVAMWRLTQDLTKMIAEEYGAKFIEIPNETIDSQGLLRTEYWTDDLTHANESFGALILEEILEKLGVE